MAKSAGIICRFVCCAAVVGLAVPAFAQQEDRPSEAGIARSGSKPSPPGMKPVVPLSSTELYAGWRVSHVLGRDVVSKAGGTLGTLRNVLLNPQGMIEAFLVDSRPSRTAEFIYRIPWTRMDAGALPGRIVGGCASSRRSRSGSFSVRLSEDADPSEFRVSEILGDYARLQSGLLYGYVSDVVFSRSGKMIASLMLRTALAGGGTYAFGFPGTIGAWNPHLNYYGLPYITAEQATEAGLLVKADRFRPVDAG